MDKTQLLLLKDLYIASVEKLRNYCVVNTDFTEAEPLETYPFEVHFVAEPDEQTSMFAGEEDTEIVKDMTITVGLDSTEIESSCEMKLDSAALKKLISLSEAAAHIYYHYLAAKTFHG